MRGTGTSLTIARRSFAVTWLVCSAIVLFGLAATTLVLQFAVVGRLSIGGPRIIAEVASAVVQGLAVALLLRRRWNKDAGRSPAT